MDELTDVISCNYESIEEQSLFKLLKLNPKNQRTCWIYDWKHLVKRFTFRKMKETEKIIFIQGE